MAIYAATRANLLSYPRKTNEDSKYSHCFILIPKAGLGREVIILIYRGESYLDLP